MKTHFAVQGRNAFGGALATTLCGRMNKTSADGMNSTGTVGHVTCAFCKDILTDTVHPRHRRFILGAARAPQAAVLAAIMGETK